MVLPREWHQLSTDGSCYQDCSFYRVQTWNSRKGNNNNSDHQHHNMARLSTLTSAGPRPRPAVVLPPALLLGTTEVTLLPASCDRDGDRVAGWRKQGRSLLPLGTTGPSPKCPMALSSSSATGAGECSHSKSPLISRGQVLVHTAKGLSASNLFLSSSQSLGGAAIPVALMSLNPRCDTLHPHPFIFQLKG